jgi:hypothetical protein
MSTRLPTRQELEADASGRTLFTGAPGHTDDAEAHAWARAFMDGFEGMLANVVEERRLDIIVGPLRLVHVTDDFERAVLHWQAELGLREHGVTQLQEGHGIVVGKTLTWPGPEHPLAVVVLPAGLMHKAVEGSGWGKAILAHELGHVYDLAHRMTLPGFDPHDDVTMASYRQWMGSSIWGECIANAVATPWSVEDMHEGDLENWPRRLADTMRDISSRVAEHKRTRMPGLLWPRSFEPVSTLLQEMGRIAGTALTMPDEYEERWLAATLNVSPQWDRVVRDSLNSLDDMLNTWGEWEVDRTSELDFVADAAMLACGIRIHHRPDGRTSAEPV